jgi:hypothetical protein
MDLGLNIVGILLGHAHGLKCFAVMTKKRSRLISTLPKNPIASVLMNLALSAP